MSAEFDQPMPGNGKIRRSRLCHRKGGPGAGWRLAWPVLYLVAFAEPVQASADAGASSSASMRISVSVAPRNWLGAAGDSAPSNDLKQAGSGSYCIETNGQAMPLPVMLVWPVARDASTSLASSEENAAELPPCGAPQATAAVPGERPFSAVVLVRPE